MNLNDQTGKSLLIWGGVILLAMTLFHGASFFFGPPIFLIGILAFIAWKKGWLGDRPRDYGAGPRQVEGVPPFFEEWHRRAHEADGRPLTPATASSVGPVAPATPAPAPQPAPAPWTPDAPPADQATPTSDAGPVRFV